MRNGVVIVALMLAGCAPVGPDFVRPDPQANPAWLDVELDQFVTESPDLADWWKALDDPVLDNLIDVAHKQNNGLQIAGLRVIEAQANLQLVTGNKYPQSQAVAGSAMAIGKSNRDSDSVFSDLEFSQYSLGASVSWEIDFWGKFRRGIEAADAGLFASIAGYDQAMVILTASVADIYVLIRSIEEQLRLAQDSLTIQQRSYEIVQVLYRNGSSSELDALQAHTLLLGTQAVVPQLETNLQQTKNALSTLLGKAPSDMSSLLAGPSVLPDIPPSIAVGIPADMLRQRPDVRGAELQARAQNAIVGVATANLYPSFSLSGSLGLSSTSGSSTSESPDGGLSNLFGSDSLTYSIGPSFVWPFLNYGRIRNNIRVQDARLQQSLLNYHETVLQAAREAEDAMAALAGTQKQDKILAEGVATAQRSADLSFLRYREGFADYQRVLNAQQSLFTQQQRYATNKGAVISSLIALYRSLGGGWQTGGPREFVDDETQQQMKDRSNWGDLLDNPPQQPREQP
jgi:NodT family efflux transporter outer membrane factor (OMF) lipoprotein